MAQAVPPSSRPAPASSPRSLPAQLSLAIAADRARRLRDDEHRAALRATRAAFRAASDLMTESRRELWLASKVAR